MAPQSISSNPNHNFPLISNTYSHPYAIYAITNRPPTIGGNISGAHGRDSIQVVCPYTGSNLTNVHPLRLPPSAGGGSSGGGGGVGVRCLIPVPLSKLIGRGGGGESTNATLFVGYGGDGDSKPGGKNDHIFLLSRQSVSGGGDASDAGNFGVESNPRWKTRIPAPISSAPQSLSVSPCGRFLAAGSNSGNCYLWEWTAGEDNLVKVWKAHYRPVTCLLFDNADGGTLLTAGEDGVVNAWCVIDLLDHASGGAVHPFRTWSEHHLPVTSLCILNGGGVGSTRLASSSLDRSLIIMELSGGNEGGSGRTLARICLPSGLNRIISDSLGGRLYGAGSDGTIYCVDLDAYSMHSTLSGTSTYLNVDQCCDPTMKSDTKVNFESVLRRDHTILSSSESNHGISTDQEKYVSELKGHAKSVVSLALLDPGILPSSTTTQNTTVLLASGSEDSTVRIWDLRSRSCVKVIMPWTSSSESAINSPVCTIIAVPRSSLSSSNTPGASSASSFASNFATGYCLDSTGDFATWFKPLKRFVRGSSIVSHSQHNEAGQGLMDPCAPVLWPRRGESFSCTWEDSVSSDYFQKKSKKARICVDSGRNPVNFDLSDVEAVSDKAEIARLEKELKKSQAVINRWREVNNQLVLKLKKKK